MPWLSPEIMKDGDGAREPHDGYQEIPGKLHTRPILANKRSLGNPLRPLFRTSLPPPSDQTDWANGTCAPPQALTTIAPGVVETLAQASLLLLVAGASTGNRAPTSLCFSCFYFPERQGPEIVDPGSLCQLRPYIFVQLKDFVEGAKKAPLQLADYQ